jgi:hypothetical protein
MLWSIKDLISYTLNRTANPQLSSHSTDQTAWLKHFWGYVTLCVANLTEEKSLRVQRDLGSGYSGPHHHTVTYRAVAKLSLCKQRPLLGNARSKRTSGLCNPCLSNGSVNTFLRKRTRAQQYENRVFVVVRAKGISWKQVTDWPSVAMWLWLWLWLWLWPVQLSAESRAVKRRLGDWYETADSLGPS